MKIILATSRVHTARGIIGEYCAKALQALGHEVYVFDISGQGCRFLKGLKSAVRHMFPRAPSLKDFGWIKEAVKNRVNKSLRETVARFKPDIVLVLLGEDIRPETIQAIRAMAGSRVVNWLFDSLLLDYRREFFSRVVGAYDYIFLIDSPEILKTVQIPAQKIFSLPLAADPQKFRRLVLSASDCKKYGSDVAFVGTVTQRRKEILKGLRDFDFKIWGLWQGKDPDLVPFYAEQDVYGGKAVKIFNAAKIIIDLPELFTPGKELYHVSPRMFEVPACAGFLLAPCSCQVPELYKLGEEMVCYRDFDELKRLIRYYLDHPAQRCSIAQKAYTRAHTAHTYAIRLKQLTDIVSAKERQ